MKPSLYQVILSDAKGIVYNENLPFRIEPTEEDIRSFILLVRPELKYSTVNWIYQRESRDKEL